MNSSFGLMPTHVVYAGEKARKLCQPVPAQRVVFGALSVCIRFHEPTADCVG